jgi:hypothetical protein
MQAIPDEPGTEVFLESTANGMGNYFHEQWKMAESGDSRYLPIFVPWYWQAEYRSTVAEDFVLTDEEAELQAHYGLDDAQLAWRRNKITELSTGAVDGLRQFRQEYPFNAAEAFQMSGADTLIGSDVVMRARNTRVDAIGPKVLGIDPSFGGDRFAIVFRQGRKIHWARSYSGSQIDTVQKRLAKCRGAIDEVKPDAVFVDAGGGADLVDLLQGQGCSMVTAVAFGGTPLAEERFVNRRAEMIGLLAEWLSDENMPVDIPDNDELHADLVACPYDVDVDRRIKIKEKKQIKKEFGFSPDLLDAAGLTFAAPVGFVKDEPIPYKDAAIA